MRGLIEGAWWSDLFVSSSVIAIILGVCFECTDWNNFPCMRGLPVKRAVSVVFVASAS
jgi:hypothetical protein